MTAIFEIVVGNSFTSRPRRSFNFDKFQSFSTLLSVVLFDYLCRR